MLVRTHSYSYRFSYREMDTTGNFPFTVLYYIACTVKLIFLHGAGRSKMLVKYRLLGDGVSMKIWTLMRILG